MKLQEEQINSIKRSFNTMKSKEDFLSLMNYAKRILYGEKVFDFTIKNINYHANPKLNRNRYRKFSIKKKSGGERIINAPAKGLKALQKCLNLIFQTIYEVNPAANGFVNNKSIVDNAKIHEASIYVYNIDLKDFFSSIDQARVWGRLRFPPFNLNEKHGKQELANIIASLCGHEFEVERMNDNKEWHLEKRFVLPQGAPTSPTLSNIICQQLDFYLTSVAKRFGLKYSRYADDITFSSMHNVYQPESDFSKEINRIITEQGFHIKESKTRLQKDGYRKEVTGLNVNVKANVQKRYVKQLRMWLYLWENYGYEKASSFFLKEYILNKGHISKGKPNMANVIGGKLDYLKMVKGNQNNLFIKLKERFDNLSGRDENIQNRENHLNKVIEIIFDKGIDSAMDFYKSNDS